MSESGNTVLSLWKRLTPLPLGKRLFSRIVCFKAPYFGSIRPVFEELQSGYGVVRLKNRRAVQNHIGTVHAIAMCNASSDAFSGIDVA